MPSLATKQPTQTINSPWWMNPAFLLGGAIVLGHAPLASLHLRSLWQQEQYQYFPFVIGAFLYLLWSRWQEAPNASPEPSRWKCYPFWIVLAITLLVGSILVVSPWLSWVSLNTGLVAVLLLVNRQRAIRFIWGIWLLLWLIVPPPLDVDHRLVRSLQRLSSQLSSSILDLFGILHLMSGNVLQLPTKKFFVDEACSGIISVMSMIACATIYAVWKNRSYIHLVALVVAGVTWALVLNVLRICLIAVAFHYFDIDLSEGAVHEALGLALFLMMFLALVSTDYLLNLMLAPIDLSHLGETGKNNWFVRMWNRQADHRTSPDDSLSTEPTQTDADAKLQTPRVKTVLAWSAPFLILGVVQLLWLPSPDSAEAARAIASALALKEESLPRQIGTWTLESFETIERETASDFGKHSQSYRYRHNEKEGVKVTISLDFPYLGGWHDLCVCYRNSGWSVSDRIIESGTESQAGGDWKYVTGDLEDPSMGKAYVSFAGFDAHGELAEPAGDAVLFRPWFRLRRRLLRNMAPQLFQVQAFTLVNARDDLDLREDINELLLRTRNEFRSLVAVPR